MTDPLFAAIDRFDQWARSQYAIPQDEIPGDWECGYHDWPTIWIAFENFLLVSNAGHWSDATKDRLLYIIARDHESGSLANMLPEPALIVLTAHAIRHGYENDKWQLAIQLHRLSDRQLATKLLEVFVNDEQEYVNRRALMELGRVRAPKVEYYAALFWNRDTYRQDGMDEYQRMAVLYALKAIHSPLLEQYLLLAKQDGRPYLVGIALKIAGE